MIAVEHGERAAGNCRTKVAKDASGALLTVDPCHSIHVNPRGIVHDLRALNEDVQFISVFTPQLPPGGDTNMVK